MEGGIKLVQSTRTRNKGTRNKGTRNNACTGTGAMAMAIARSVSRKDDVTPTFSLVQANVHVRTVVLCTGTVPFCLILVLYSSQPTYTLVHRTPASAPASASSLV
jgi:hypothetical protein